MMASMMITNNNDCMIMIIILMIMIIILMTIIKMIIIDDDHQEELINRLEEPCRGAAEAMLCHYAFPGDLFDHHHYHLTIILDHNDPSKPSHPLTNGPKPSKTIESDGCKTKNH